MVWENTACQRRKFWTTKHSNSVFKQINTVEVSEHIAAIKKKIKEVGAETEGDEKRKPLLSWLVSFLPLMNYLASTIVQTLWNHPYWASPSSMIHLLTFFHVCQDDNE